MTAIRGRAEEHDVYFNVIDEFMPKKETVFIENEYLSGIKRNTLDYNDTKYQLESRENKMDHIVPFFKEISKNFNRIELDESILSGMPTIKNTRIPVNLIVTCLRDGMTLDEVIEDYNVSNKDVTEALEFIIDILTRPYMAESD